MNAMQNNILSATKLLYETNDIADIMASTLGKKGDGVNLVENLKLTKDENGKLYADGQDDATLANEIGDVMFQMEYNKESEYYSEKDANSNENYYKIGSPGEYSRRVEQTYLYRKQLILNNPNIQLPNVYPLSRMPR